MKKLIVSLLFVVCCMIFSACKAEEIRYYYSAPVASVENEEKISSEITSISDEQKEICLEVYQKLVSYYKIEKTVPNFSYFGKNDYSDTETLMNVRAYYDSNNKTVYIKTGFSKNKNDIATVCHELLHYLSDNGEGAYYTVGKYRLGNKFLEGVTNYLSTQIYEFDGSTSIYEFETHVAKMFANAFGEDNLRKSYFTNDWSSLKADFDALMCEYYPNEEYEEETFSPFDVFMGNMNTYNLLLSVIDVFPESMQDIIKVCDSCEEEIYLYNSVKGNKDSAEVIIKDFLKNDNLGITSFTHFKQIIGG